VSSVRYELSFYMPEDDSLLKDDVPPLSQHRRLSCTHVRTTPSFGLNVVPCTLRESNTLRPVRNQDHRKSSANN
jgi:hypothetical protein